MDDMPQLGLFDGLADGTIDPIERDFLEFHRTNPAVFRQLVSIAREVKRSGLDRGSISLVFETLRYRAITTTGRDYKLNNNHRSRYARLIMDTHLDLAGWFKVRDLRG